MFASDNRGGGLLDGTGARFVELVEIVVNPGSSLLNARQRTD